MLLFPSPILGQKPIIIYPYIDGNETATNVGAGTDIGYISQNGENIVSELTSAQGGALQRFAHTGAPMQTSGKYYFEVTWSQSAGDTASFNCGVGLANTNGIGSGWAGTQMGMDTASASIGYIFGSGFQRVYLNNVNQVTVIANTIAGGDVIACAVDFGLSRYWFKNITKASNWNASGSADPGAGTGGLAFTVGTGWLPCCNVAPVATSGHSFGYNFNFGRLPWTGTLPTGFTGWPVIQPNTTWYLDPTKTTCTTTGQASLGTLSNGNLTFTAAFVSGQVALTAASREIDYNDKRCLYMEWTQGAANTNIAYGFISRARGCRFTGEQISKGSCFNNHSVGIAYLNTGTPGVESGGTYITTFNIGSIAANDVIGVAIRMDVKKIWWRRITAAGVAGNWDNNATHDPVNNVGGVGINTDMQNQRLRPAFGGALSTGTLAVTANFGGTAFKAGLPSGMTAMNAA